MTSGSCRSQMSNSSHEFEHACYGIRQMRRELLQEGFDTPHRRRHAGLKFELVFPGALTVSLGVRVNAAERVRCSYEKSLIFDEC